MHVSVDGFEIWEGIDVIVDSISLPVHEVKRREDKPQDTQVIHED